jgi:hypothetical protein
MVINKMLITLNDLLRITHYQDFYKFVHKPPPP